MDAWRLLRWRGGEPERERDREREFEGERARVLLLGDERLDQSLPRLEEGDRMMASNCSSLRSMSE